MLQSTTVAALAMTVGWTHVTAVSLVVAGVGLIAVGWVARRHGPQGDQPVAIDMTTHEVARRDS